MEYVRASASDKTWKTCKGNYFFLSTIFIPKYEIDAKLDNEKSDDLPVGRQSNGEYPYN